MAEISLCMIVKNEEKVLARCLESVRELVDEIVIADTGSEDRTVEIARQYTGLVYEIPWKDDFAWARNFSFSKAGREYCMWLDADDVISPENREKFLASKKRMDGTEDVVMMKYGMNEGPDGVPSFSYYRERILKNHRGFRWKGRVHEAIEPRGKIVYWDAVISHKKEGAGEPGRNLRIYEKMKEEEEAFGPRELFYYGRELMYNGRFRDGAEILQKFLKREDGWVENKVEACMNLALCLGKIGRKEEELQAMLRTLEWGEPRAETCCGIGGWFMEREDWKTAAFWYRQALAAERPDEKGGFVREEYYGFVPELQLCVCFDRMGDREEAYRHHLRARELKPDAAEVRYNEAYFQRRENGNPAEKEL